MKAESEREAPVSVLRALSPLWRLRRLVRDVRLLGPRFGLRHWCLQNRIDNARFLRFVRCVRRLGWKFGLRYWRMHDGLRERAGRPRRPARPEATRLGGLRRQLRGAESRLGDIRGQLRRLERAELDDRTSQA